MIYSNYDYMRDVMMGSNSLCPNRCHKQGGREVTEPVTGYKKKLLEEAVANLAKW